MDKLINHEYLVTIKKYKNIIQVTLPDRKIYPYNIKSIKKYITIDDKLYIYDSNVDKNLFLINVPNYAIPALIYIEILYFCIRLKYNIMNVKVEESYGIDNLINLLDLSDLRALKLINGICNNSGINYFISNNIQEGYDRILEIFKLKN